MSITYEPIATTTVSTATHPVTFSSIPSTYTDLIAVVSPIGTAGNYDLSIRFNSDSGTNYSWAGINFNADNSGAAYSTRGTNTTFFPTSTNVATVTPYPVVIHIQNYANTNIYKACISRIARETYAVALNSGLWRSTSAINEVSFILTGGGSTTFKAGTVISLYGIKAE
jgi:hypothetical protein